MLLYEKYSTLGTVITTILTVIGTIAGLSYYLSISRFNTAFGFVSLFIGYLTVLIITYSYFNGRLEKDVRES
ncbi:MAG: hypothetical protein AABY07_04490 [Nanoarchaeota archaeon]